MTENNIQQKKCEVWSHGHYREVGSPKPLHGCGHGLILWVPELVLPVAIHTVEEVPRQQHSYPQPAADYVDKVVFVLWSRVTYILYIITHFYR